MISLVSKVNAYQNRNNNVSFGRFMNNKLSPLKADTVSFSSKNDNEEDLNFITCEKLSKKIFGKDVKVIKNYHASEEIKGFYVQRDNFYDRHPATGIMNFDENGKLMSVTFQEHEGGSLVSLGRTVVYDLKGNILKELSKEQTKEIRSYRGNMAININNILRNDGENNEFWKPYIDIMDSLFKSDKIYSRTTKPMTVYRGIDINQRLWNILEGGNTFLEKGYMSTSRDKDIAKRNGNYLLEIEIPKGTKYLDMGLLTKVSDFYIEEQEMLFDRNTTLKIKEYNPETRTVKAEILPVKTRNEV